MGAVFIIVYSVLFMIAFACQPDGVFSVADIIRLIVFGAVFVWGLVMLCKHGFENTVFSSENIFSRFCVLFSFSCSILAFDKTLHVLMANNVTVAGAIILIAHTWAIAVIGLFLLKTK